MHRFIGVFGLVGLVACSSPTASSSSTGSGSGGSAGGSSSSGSGGSAGAPSATVDGAVAGYTLSPAYAVAAANVADPGSPSQITVLISTFDDYCSVLQASVANHVTTEKANVLELALVLGEAGGDAGAVTPGTYTASGGPDQLQGVFHVWDANCMSGADMLTGGSVTLTTAGAVYSGTFDLMFGAGPVTGTFAAPLCDTSMSGDGGTTGDGGVVCEP